MKRDCLRQFRFIYSIRTCSIVVVPIGAKTWPKNRLCLRMHGYANMSARLTRKTSYILMYHAARTKCRWKNAELSGQVVVMVPIFNDCWVIFGELTLAVLGGTMFKWATLVYQSRAVGCTQKGILFRWKKVELSATLDTYKSLWKLDNAVHQKLVSARVYEQSQQAAPSQILKKSINGLSTSAISN